MQWMKLAKRAGYTVGWLTCSTAMMQVINEDREAKKWHPAGKVAAVAGAPAVFGLGLPLLVVVIAADGLIHLRENVRGLLD